MTELKSGAQPGNTNNTKNRPWQQAIDQALKTYHTKGESKVEAYWALKEIAIDLVKDSLSDDHAIRSEARKLMGDRFEGKAIQSIDHGGTIGIEAYELTGTERSQRIAAILETARARGAGQTDND